MRAPEEQQGIRVRRKRDEWRKCQAHEGPLHGYYGKKMCRQSVCIQRRRMECGHDSYLRLDAGEARAGDDVTELTESACTHLHMGLAERPVVDHI